MKIGDILKPKSREELDQAVVNLITEAPTLVEFVVDHDIIQWHRVLKAYHYIADDLLKQKDPNEVYIIFTNSALYKIIEKRLSQYDYSNHPIKNVQFLGGPFKYALVKKGSGVAELYGGSLSAVMIGLDHILDLISN